MEIDRFRAIIGCYSDLRIAVFGDFCLDRYLEIDPAKAEQSIETGLPVHNVMNVRAQPGGAGTILNNLVALGIGKIYPIGFAGEDGEGYELWRALESMAGVQLSHFVRTEQRRTFTYCKPLLTKVGEPPVELNRLDFKNWVPTPASLQELLASRLASVAEQVDGIIVLDQVDIPQTGVVTEKTLGALERVAAQGGAEMVVLADSRRGLRNFPRVIFKMNASELAALTGSQGELGLEQIKTTAATLAHKQGQHVFVTLAERGMIGASPTGVVEHVAALAVRGPIDIVGAGDAVTANLTTALIAGAALREAMELASTAASVVIHKLGTTGTASPSEMEPLAGDC
jgi:rfaE bifunctional protein kinase chain/domain